MSASARESPATGRPRAAASDTISRPTWLRAPKTRMGPLINSAILRFAKPSGTRHRSVESHSPASKEEQERMRKIRKAVFPVAGLGTRFLPATKAMPKEMLTVVDRPLIQHVVDEAREAGIEHFIFVTGRNKGVIEDHFDRQFELEIDLARARQEDRARAPGARSSRRRARRASSASNRRSGSATRYGARAKSSATSPSRCCSPTSWCRRKNPASRR